MSDTYFEPLPPPRPRLSWTRFIVDYNPCFLLSAVCMLFGCRLLNDAVNARTGDLRGALLLILTINVYEFCLLGVAVLIQKIRGMRRDVGILLVVAVMFLCDIAFVVGDLSTARPGVGLIVMLLLTALAGVKTWLALGLLGSPKRHRTVAIVVGQLAMILLLPIVLKAIALQHDGYLPPMAIYVGWWIAGLLPIGIRLILQHRTTDRLPGLTRMYVVVPYIAMLGHLLACTWVFKLPFYVACYSPVLIGLAIVAGMSRDTIGRFTAINIEWSLAALAVLLAIETPDQLAIVAPHHWGVVSATRLTLFAMGCVNLHGMLVLRHPVFYVTFAGMISVAILIPTFWLIFDLVAAVFEWIGSLVKRLIPKTTAQWGIFTIATSFLLLGLGAIVSLLKNHSKPADQEVAT